tara:strand:- start:11398 stop:11748 length:351 start_codon:yes stop_codon:yes gene_type:complete
MTAKSQAQAVDKDEEQAPVAKATNYNTVTLDTPLMRGKTEVTEIQFRKPNAGELRGVSLTDLLQMQTDALVTVIPRISLPSLTATEVRTMDVADLVQCGGEIISFLLPKRAKEQAE